MTDGQAQITTRGRMTLLNSARRPADQIGLPPGHTITTQLPERAGTASRNTSFPRSYAKDTMTACCPNAMVPMLDLAAIGSHGHVLYMYRLCMLPATGRLKTVTDRAGLHGHGLDSLTTPSAFRPLNERGICPAREKSAEMVNLVLPKGPLCLYFLIQSCVFFGCRVRAMSLELLCIGIRGPPSMEFIRH